jgi:methionyl-tRNA formyltransferase
MFSIESYFHTDLIEFHAVESKEEFDRIDDYAQYDVIIFIGWSWIVKQEVLDSALCLCIHPSNLPQYRGGSPIQNQIMDGVLDTKVTLFEMTDKLDAGDIYGQVDLDLRGDLEDILEWLSSRTVTLITDYLRGGEEPKPVKQDESKATYCKRRKPEESEITLRHIEKYLTAEEMYNKIRALQDPYPNAYIVCADGKKLYITGARLVK